MTKAELQVCALAAKAWAGGTGVHFVIDNAKCCKDISTWQDQALHLACKVVWFIIAWRVAT